MTISKWVGREHISLINDSDMRIDVALILFPHMALGGRTGASRPSLMERQLARPLAIDQRINQTPWLRMVAPGGSQSDCS